MTAIKYRPRRMVRAGLTTTYRSRQAPRDTNFGADLVTGFVYFVGVTALAATFVVTAGFIFLP